jgi:hypothetical protein
MLSTPGQRADCGESAAADMKHRHRVHPHSPAFQPRALGHETGCVHDAPVVKNGSLGKSGGPGRVLDLHRIVWPHVRELLRWASRPDENAPVRETNDLPQIGEICSDLREDGRHVVAPVLLKIKESQCARLPQHIREFL